MSIQQFQRGHPGSHQQTQFDQQKLNLTIGYHHKQFAIIEKLLRSLNFILI